MYCFKLYIYKSFLRVQRYPYWKKKMHLADIKTKMYAWLNCDKCTYCQLLWTYVSAKCLECKRKCIVSEISKVCRTNRNVSKLVHLFGQKFNHSVTKFNMINLKPHYYNYTYSNIAKSNIDDFNGPQLDEMTVLCIVPSQVMLARARPSCSSEQLTIKGSLMTWTPSFPRRFSPRSRTCRTFSSGCKTEIQRLL